jgi:lipopolysaccharide export system protein LptC
MSARNVLGFALLVVAAAGSWFLKVSLQPPEVEETSRNTRSGGFYLRSATMLGTDANGELLYEIEAEYAEQLPNEEIEFRNVRISYSPEATVPWTLNADTAVIGRNQERVVLTGDVVAVSSEGLSGEPTEIRTSYLEFDPATYRAETESRVQIRVGSRSLAATGMLALLQEDKLQLKSNVSGRFFP